ncbi:MAG: carbohydrate binding family 9 domain-containing protein, partial [Flavobacteriaceae bacterium]|nr:carbohydrate binding family 9 domain-containing protein [Flavobacteriaceae bacterium]
MKNLLILIFLFSTCLFAQEQQKKQEIVTKRIYTTKYIGQQEAPVIDGLLDDASWNIVEWDGDFVEWRPDENTPPHQQTKFKIVYDKKNIYVGVRLYDKQPDSIVKRLSRRDGFAGDWIEINFDSYHDLRSGFSFNVTAVGVKGDEFISNNGNNWDDSWNPIWYAKTNIDEQGWTAEMKIPLSQLRFGKAKEQIWGLQLNRRIFRKEERSLWQRVPQDSPGWISELGELHGLIDLEPQKQLEIQPFTVTKADNYPREDGNPFRDGRDSELNGGLDAKIGITNDLTLDLTVNPDFGQVEADPSAIALDGFEIFFREQRPFFVENNNIFDYRFSRSNAGDTFGSDNLFFSRRIGRSPQGFPETEDNEYVDQPLNTTILGAAKFSGKTKNGWSIGVLESVTAKEYAEIAEVDDGEVVERREEV